MSLNAGTSDGAPEKQADADDDAAAAAVQQQQLDTSLASSTNSTQHREELLSKRRKEIFGDCALIEIIHLHDCLRGALKALEADVNALTGVVAVNINNNNINNSGQQQTTIGTLDDAATEHSMVADLERRVAGRFKVIWSVFKSHSQAEDEFIWPALKVKTQGEIASSPKNSPKHAPGQNNNAKDESAAPSVDDNNNDNLMGQLNQDDNVHLEQEEYEEDHADEERMFSEMDTLLGNLREVLLSDFQNRPQPNNADRVVNDLARILSDHTRRLSQHLMAHLEKEETQCMPLVIKHLSKSEIHELVGKIMGQRSADTIAQIMTMAVQNLDQVDREEMVKYMKQSMAGTFFDRWLTMSGWNGSTEVPDLPAHEEDEPHPKLCRQCATGPSNQAVGGSELEDERKRAAAPMQGEEADACQEKKRAKVEDDREDIVSQVTEPSMVDAAFGSSASSLQAPAMVSSTSQAELEKLIRAIASNPSLTPAQKNTTIQGLRDSVWKSNQRQKEMMMGPPTVVNVTVPNGPTFLQLVPNSTVSVAATAGSTSLCSGTGTRRVTPPSVYFKKVKDGTIETVWTSDSPSSAIIDKSVPLFSAAELAPTYHDGAAGAVLGCPHYARACKLRHPKSGRLYTCRLCCEQQREMPMKDKDEPLDRYAVTEVMCMKCNALQPAEDRCINADCESRGKPFARYFCRICHLYDDGSRPIFHCPYCNACRLGLGLGVDFRHCMRCNACVSLADTDHHCIPQKLQGSCPICRESLFQSTEPLRGLKCGHVMHLACFTEYRRGLAYTCPLCMRSMEDMKDYFALLDTAVRMQPMPAAYLSTMSNIYCQDCCKTGRTRYHFVGQKCPNCASYNTRELGRVHESPNSSPRTGDHQIV